MASARGMILRAVTYAAALSCALVGWGCDRAKPAPRDPVGGGTQAEPAVVTAATGGAPVTWDDELGGVIAAPSLDGGAPVAFVHDTGRVTDIRVELFNHTGISFAATLQPGAAIGACGWRRRASIAPGSDSVAPHDWLLALEPGLATPIEIRSADTLLSRDSSALVARVSRVLSRILEDSASLPFRGLPIVVREAWQFRLADGTWVTVAMATRSLNVESNPRTEATLLVAEPDPSASSGDLRLAFHRRAVGPEDHAEGMDLLSALRLHAGATVVAIAREGDDGVRLEFVARDAPGAWSLRWSSAVLPCPPG